jgi:hypothetical protein
MLGVWRNALPIFFLAISLLSVSSRTETPEKKGYLRGNASSDLRADLGVEHRLRSNFADWALERTRSIVVTAGAQRESVGQRLLKFVDEAVAQTTDADSAKVPVEESKESTQKTAPTAPAKPQPPAAVKAKTPESRSKASSPAQPAASVDTSQEQKSAAGKSPSILQMLEGHETELMIAAAIAATFFLIGWICGGHYYLRRDRRRRTKIRF